MTDAQSALERVKREAATKERERLAEIVRKWRNDVPMTGEECANAILALMEDTDDE